MNPSSTAQPLQTKTYQEHNEFCVYDALAISDFSPQMLHSEYWVRQQAVTGTAQGRGTTWFVSYHGQEWVLRHYYRGGLMGKLNKDKYWFSSQMKTRAAREFELLTRLQQLQLPAPKPVAYRVQRKGLFYRADLLSCRIHNAQDLVAILSQHALATQVWHEIGLTIRRFHVQGIYHFDLNAHNILLDTQNNVWLIDFDRGEQRKPALPWQQANMARLLRSFQKEASRIQDFHWQQSNWQTLLEGYASL